ncbi:hypothetical protein [Actinoplanes sp. NPDC049265]|uniref:hypothetical protein n=1 Tax=Actinoplanes sp. NPDC049265 TaxID=3363902 RepID=UPI00371E15CF
MYRWRTMTTATAIGLAGALALPAAAPAADDTRPELVSVEITTPQVDVGNSYGDGQVMVAVHLRDAEGLPDTIHVECCTDNKTVVVAKGTGWYPEMPYITWTTLGRGSGTRQDGTWYGQVTVSPAWSGTFQVTQVQIDDDQNGQFFFPVTNGPTVTVTGGERWVGETVRTPVKVVTGQEGWHPRVRVVNTVTGQPVGGARVQAKSIFDDWYDLAAVPPSPPPGTAADSTGLWTDPTEHVRGDFFPEERLLVYARRGTRGYSQQGLGCPDFTAKIQASETFAGTTVGVAEPITVTGNVWPAPSILGAASAVWLQRDVGGGTWQTVASVPPRQNGRYTLQWAAPNAGRYSLRVRVPGSGSAASCTGLQSVGTALAATTVTVR